MRLTKAWTVASKDFKIFTKKKSILYSIVGFQIFVSVGLPLIIRFAVEKATGSATPAVREGLPVLINGFSFWFVMGAAFIPTGIASYSLVGEKIQRSLEPLLATPTTDAEILAGKAIAAFIPSIVSTYIGAVVFMSLVDAFTSGLFGYLYFPNWGIGLILLLLAPLSCILSVEGSVLISSRSNDVRTAQQLGALIFVPIMVVYVLSLLTVLSLTVTNLLIIAATLFFIDVALFYVAMATFRREEILTKWR